MTNLSLAEMKSLLRLAQSEAAKITLAHIRIGETRFAVNGGGTSTDMTAIFSAPPVCKFGRPVSQYIEEAIADHIAETLPAEALCQKLIAMIAASEAAGEGLGSFMSDVGP